MEALLSPQPPARPALVPGLRFREGGSVAAAQPVARRRSSAPAGTLLRDCKAPCGRAWAPCTKAAAAAAAEAAAESDVDSSVTGDALSGPSDSPPWAPPPALDSEVEPAAGSLWALALCPASGAVFAGGRAGALRWAPPACLSVCAQQAAAQQAAAPCFALLRRGAEGAYALEAHGDTLFVGCGDGAVRALSSSAEGNTALLATYGQGGDDAEAAGVYALALARAAGVLYAGAEDGSIRGWRVAGAGAGGCAESLEGHHSAVTALAAAPAAPAAPLGPLGAVALVSGCEGGALRGWRAGGDGTAAWEVDDAHAAGVTALAWAPHGVIYSSSWDGDVRATRAADGALLAHWPRALGGGCSETSAGPSSAAAEAAAESEASAQPAASAGGVAVTALALGPRGALWAGGGDGSVARLCCRTGAVTASMPAAHGRRGVTALAASPCGERLYSAGLDRVARAWTVAPPARWSRSAHPRFPKPFCAAMAMLRRGCADAQCVLGRTLGGMDVATRDGILELVAAALAGVAYLEQEQQLPELC